jgi:hypothetical protein
MTACLALHRDYSRKHVAVDDPTESQVAASDSSRFPKGASPEASRASGVSKFFENIKPLSDWVGAILDAAGGCIGHLFNLDKLFDREISSTDQEEADSKGVKNNPASLESHSASGNGNEFLTPKVVELSFSPVAIYSPSEDAQAACNPAVQNSQGSNLQAREGADKLPASGREKPGSKRFIQNSSRRKINSAPEEGNAKLISRSDAASSSGQKKPSVLENAKPPSSSQFRDSQSSDPQKDWEGILFNGPSEDDVKNFGKLLTSSRRAREDIPTWIHV